MIWLALVAAGVVLLVLLLWLLGWICTASEIERDIAKDHFRAEQEYRAVRRAGKVSSR